MYKGVRTTMKHLLKWLFVFNLRFHYAMRDPYDVEANRRAVRVIDWLSR